MKRLLFICTLLCANVLFAQDYFWEGDLIYVTIGAGEVEVYHHRYDSSPTSVNIPSSVTHTWEHYSSSCDCYITDSVRTYSVTSIGSSVFEDCSSLTTVTIGNSVTSICMEAFEGCSSLTSITIPNSVTYIGCNAFKDCSSLTTLNFNAINCADFYFNTFNGNEDRPPFYNCPISTINIGGSVQRIPEYFAYNLSSLTSVNIPNSVTSIGYSAFEDCSSLTSVTIGNSVTSIGGAAFIDCSSLTSVTIPNSVTSIGDYAFYDCSSLTSVTIPNSVTSIGESAFKYCSSLTSVTIPNSVTSIGESAFGSCSSLTTLNFNAINCEDFEPSFHNCPISTINIGGSVQRIPEYFAYNLSSLTSVNIPNSVTSIGRSAFNSCSSLTSIDIPNSVDTIGYCTFAYCSSLTSVTIPNSVTSIGESAFEDCSSLTTVTIPNSVQWIGTFAFKDCSSLTTLNFNAINCADFYDYYYYQPFRNCPISTINIGDSVQRIPNYFARNLDSLTSVTIGNSVTSIGESAFYDCSSLTSVTIPNSVTSIGSSAFYNCDGLTSITIPNSVTSIGGYTFYGCSSLTSVTIPNSVTSIGDYAFKYCSSLRYVTCLADIPPTLGSSVFDNTPSNKILNVNCGLRNDYYISSWGNDFNSIVIFEVSPYNVVVTANNSTFGSASVINYCYTSTITAIARNCYQFVSWNDGNTENPRIVNVSSDTSFTAIFDSIVFDTTINATINAGETYAENGFNESEAGTYTQSLHTDFGCDSTITLVLSVNSSLIDIEETEITFYPNPTDSKITFSQKIEKVEVIDLTGKTIFTFSNAKTINIESLPAGAYYLRLTNEEKTSLQKVIKQ